MKEKDIKMWIKEIQKNVYEIEQELYAVKVSSAYGKTLVKLRNEGNRMIKMLKVSLTIE